MSQTEKGGGIERPDYGEPLFDSLPNLEATLALYRNLKLSIDPADSRQLGIASPESELLLLYWTALKSRTTDVTLFSYLMAIASVGLYARQTQHVKANSQVFAVVTESTFKRLKDYPKTTGLKLKPETIQFKFEDVDTKLIRFPVDLKLFQMFIGSSIHDLALSSHPSIQSPLPTPFEKTQTRLRFLTVLTESFERLSGLKRINHTERPVLYIRPPQINPKK